MDILRFATAGSVDDGKSTLIGRLLLDSKQIFEDQLEAVQRTVGELRRPLDGLVDAVFVEETSCRVTEEFGLSGQDPPAEALVVLALSGSGGRDAGVGKVSG